MLCEMAADERPRETLKVRGSAAQSDGELLAITIDTGSVWETDARTTALALDNGLSSRFDA
jgi:DNA repair protein RadC